MSSRYEVELTLTSAKDLKNVNWRHGPIKPYAVVWVEPDRKVTSRVDEEGDTCPHWEQTLVVPFDRPIEDATLRIDVVHAYADEDTKPLIGSAKLPLRDVIDDVGLGSRATLKLKLKRPSGRPHGKVEVNVAVRDSRYHAPPYGVDVDNRGASNYAPSYGAPPPAGGYPYGQPAGYGQPGGYGSGYGQPAGYGSGYGPEYGQPGQVVEEKKSGFGGMGMGTGLAVGAVAGVLGGLAIAEGVDQLEDHIADEAAEKVEADLADGDYGDGDDGGW